MSNNGSMFGSDLQESTYFHPHIHTAWQHVVRELLTAASSESKSDDSSAEKLPVWTKLWKDVVEGELSASRTSPDDGC
jgi:hypothetical protein